MSKELSHEIRFYKPGLPDWDIVKGDIEETYRSGIFIQANTRSGLKKPCVPTLELSMLLQ